MALQLIINQPKNIDASQMPNDTQTKHMYVLVGAATPDAKACLNAFAQMLMHPFLHHGCSPSCTRLPVKTFSMSTSEVHHPNTPSADGTPTYHKPTQKHRYLTDAKWPSNRSSTPPKYTWASPKPNDTQTVHQPHPNTPGLHRCQKTPKLIINPAQIHLGFTDAK